MEDLLSAPNPQRITPAGEQQRSCWPFVLEAPVASADAHALQVAPVCGIVCDHRLVHGSMLRKLRAALLPLLTAAAGGAHLCHADLQRCGASGIIIGLLLDVNLFWEVGGAGVARLHPCTSKPKRYSQGAVRQPTL